MRDALNANCITTSGTSQATIVNHSWIQESYPKNLWSIPFSVLVPLILRLDFAGGAEGIFGGTAYTTLLFHRYQVHSSSTNAVSAARTGGSVKHAANHWALSVSGAIGHCWRSCEIYDPRVAASAILRRRRAPESARRQQRPTN